MELRLDIYFFLCISFGPLVVHQYKSEEPCFKYTKCTREDRCDCGFLPKVRKESGRNINSRIVNGEQSTEHKYPWIAYIQRGAATTAVPPTFIEYYGGGAIISDHAIVTAGHNLCTKDGQTDVPSDPKVKLKVTCPKGGSMHLNLNMKNLNDINFGVGTNIMTLKNPWYNKDIEAYLYKYEPRDAGFSLNGDIGVVVTKTSLGIGRNKAIQKISLPLPDQFKDDLPVTMAGWGRRYIEFINPTNNRVENSSCMTNEERTSGEILHITNTPTSFNDRFEFRYCNRSPNTFCNKWLLEEKIDTLSAITNIRAITGTSNREKKLKLKRRPEQRQCEKYLEKAKKHGRKKESLK